MVLETTSGTQWQSIPKTRKRSLPSNTADHAVEKLQHSGARESAAKQRSRSGIVPHSGVGVPDQQVTLLTNTKMWRWRNTTLAGGDVGEQRKKRTTARNAGGVKKRQRQIAEECTKAKDLNDGDQKIHQKPIQQNKATKMSHDEEALRLRTQEQSPQQALKSKANSRQRRAQPTAGEEQKATSEELSVNGSLRRSRDRRESCKAGCSAQEASGSTRGRCCGGAAGELVEKGLKRQS